MKNTRIKVSDESGDRRFFTLLPNYILNHSSMYDREVYWHMKRVAGESGTFWKSEENLAKTIGISKNRLRKSIKYLLEKGWIRFVGKKPLKTRPVNEYAITDIWDENNDFYSKKISSPQTVSIKDKFTTDRKISSPQTREEEPSKEEPIENAPTSLSPAFSVKEYIQTLKGSPRRDLQLIGRYLEKRRVQFSTKKEIEVAIKRHLRAAKQLEVFSDEQIKKAVDRAEEKYSDVGWTLETLTKILTSNL